MFGWCEGREGEGGGAIGASERTLQKGLQCAWVWLPPLWGPDRYKLRAIKLSPCHLCRIQSRIERERKREGERERKKDRER